MRHNDLDLHCGEEAAGLVERACELMCKGTRVTYATGASAIRCHVHTTDVPNMSTQTKHEEVVIRGDDGLLCGPVGLCLPHVVEAEAREFQRLRVQAGVVVRWQRCGCDEGAWLERGSVAEGRWPEDLPHARVFPAR